MRTAITLLFAVIAGLSVYGCQTSGSGGSLKFTAGVTSAPLTQSGAAGAGFTQLTAEESGIDFSNPIDFDSITFAEFQYHIQSGACAGDYDGDGDVDVFLGSLAGPNKLFRNDGGFKFTDVTAEAGEGLDGGDALGCSGAFADLDGDGLLDLYVTNHSGPNQLYMNQGNGTFRDEAAERGASYDQATISAAVFDVENDGDLDLYLSCYFNKHDSEELAQIDRAYQQFFETHYSEVPSEFRDLVYIDRFGSLRNRPADDALLINDGQGHFSNGTAKAGLEAISCTLQTLACDLNNDGLTDLYISSDFEAPDRYMINNGDGTFTDRADDLTRKTPLFSMGCDAGDINGDGLPDLFTADMSSRSYKRSKRQSGDMNLWRKQMLYEDPQPQMRNMLYVNRGDGWMTELAQYAGVTSSEWTWTTRIVDLNCDGIMELFTTSGMLKDVMDVDYQNQVSQAMGSGSSMDDILTFTLSQPDYYTDNFIFTASSRDLHYNPAPQNWNMLDGAMGCGAVLEDFDGDGDLDAIINNTESEAGVWRNDMADGRAVSIDLRQDGPNWQGVGSRVWAHCGDEVYMRDAILTRGFAASETSRIYIGLGQHDQVDRLEIRWPDGKLQIEENLAAGQLHTIGRRPDLADWQPEKPQPVFRQAALDWEHTEADLDETEFGPEPLLPMLQNSLGSGAGVADFNGDGNLDIYCCGAAGQSGQLFTGDGAGGFAKSAALDGMIPPESEEMTALWFEADGDGRPDLLVTCGGMESEIGSQFYQDQLLLNKAEGFVAGQLPVMRTSTGAAAASDIDGDGDLDVVLAGHVVRFSYATPALNFILENLGDGKFTNATTKFATGFNELAQVTDVQFCDMNGDGPADMLISQKWGPVELWLNTGGKLAPSSELTASGWWQGLGIGDFDSDGDFDVVASNVGYNTKYHPKEQKPITLFAADFDNTGTRDLIEVKYDSDGLMLPGRGRSCSGYAIDYIPKRFPTWASFADATLDDIYGHKLEQAEEFEATEVRSMICLNQGDGAWDVQPLPGSAQWAPAFGVAVGDFTGDGMLDCYMANNFYDTQPETGHWNTGFGVLLKGEGNGGFTPLEPTESGVLVWQDGRCSLAGDFDNDGGLDLLLTVSNGQPQVCLNQAAAQAFTVAVTGAAGNPLGVGSTIRLTLGDGSTRQGCVQAGQGFLGSICGSYTFALAAGQEVTGCTVTCPDGSEVAAAELTASGAIVTK